MGINFRTMYKKDSARDSKHFVCSLKKLEKELRSTHTEFRIAAGKCMVAKRSMHYIDSQSSLKSCEKDPNLRIFIDALREQNPQLSLHDVHAGLESILSEYAKKVSSFAENMVTTVKQYSVSLFDLFIKKLRLTSKIDVEKFVGLDGSMTMTILTYGDYCEIGHPIVEKSQEVVKDVSSWGASLGRVKKALKENNNDQIKKMMKELTGKINNGPLVKFLKEHLLVEFQFGVDPNGSGDEGLVRIEVSKRFKEMEQPQQLNEAGWDDVDKLKNSLVLKHSEELNKTFSMLYKYSIDLMDETRRISNDYCVKDPYTCAALVKYASLVAQMVNCYTKAFDMCWTTCLRVGQACLIES